MSNIEKCSIASKCGGCQYQGIPYEKQLTKKQNQTENLFSGIIKADPIVGMDNPLFYRNKVHHALSVDKKGNIISGSYAEGTHRIIFSEQCMLEDKNAQEIIKTVRMLLKSFKIPIFDERTERGLVRHILIRKGFKSGQVMVVLVTANSIFPSRSNFVKALRSAHPEITTVVQNINGKYTGMVLGDRFITLYGKGYITDELCGFKYRISPDSFYQINPIQTEKLYNTAVEFAELKGNETVIDAYCGIGTIGITASRYCKSVIGTELNSNAVNDAIINAKENGISNARFYCSDAGDYMARLAESKKKVDVVFTDPPRSGCSERFIEALSSLSPQKIVYISCNPETQVRDIKQLIKFGYKPQRLKPFDLFPFTKHTESVCSLKLK